MTSPYFNRKIYNTRLLTEDIGYFLSHRKEIIQLRKNDKMTKSFIEKIMLVVTAVNGCPYCSWFHVRQSIAQGVSISEVQKMLKLQFHADANDSEVPALLFAQHYAETDRHPDEEQREELISYYGEQMANHILLVIRMIYFGNLSGNTFDAFLSRFKGKKSRKSNLIFEFFFFLFSAPILIPISPMVKKYGKKSDSNT